MKRLAVFIISILCFAPFLSADEQPRFFQLKDFSKGLNSHASQFSVPQGQASELLNIRVNQRYKALAKRPIMAIYGTPESKASTGLFRYYKSDDTKYLISASSTFLFVGDDSAGTFQKIGKGFTDGSRWTFATYQDIVIACNGTEQCVKYDGLTDVTANTDGHRTAEDVVAELGAPFAELNTGSNLDSEKWYAYKVAFYDGTNYYYSDAVSNPIDTGSSVQDVRLTDIPLGPTGTTHRYIFRTEGQADRATLVALDNDSYKLAITISDNTTTAQDDAVADGSLTTVFSTWISNNSASAVTPPIAKFAYIHKERLWLANNSSNRSTTWYSIVYRPQYFDANDYFDVRPDDGDEITAILEWLGVFTVFKTTTVQKIYTSALLDTDWSISPTFPAVGSPAPYSIAVTPMGIIYYGRQGIYRFTGQYSDLISDAVTKDIEDILEATISSTVGFYYKNEYHFAYASEEAGGSTNNRVLIYDLIRDAYVIDTKNVSSFAAFNSGSDFGVLYMGDSTTDGHVYINEATTDQILKRFKSNFAEGTYDDARAAAYNARGESVDSEATETDFFIENAWDTTINEAVGTINAQTGTIDRPDTGGTWTSPVYRIDAGSIATLYWGESFEATGDNITWAVRACDDAACSGESFAGTYTNPSGSDLTGVSADVYFQLRASLTSASTASTPHVLDQQGYVFKLFYSKAGSSKEDSVLSLYDSGWQDFGAGEYEKSLWRIDVYYTGTTGTVNVAYKNIEGDIDNDFDIDISTDPQADDDDEYIGTDEHAFYRHWTGGNLSSSESAVGELWKFVITEDSSDSDFKIHSIIVWYYLEELSR